MIVRTSRSRAYRRQRCRSTGGDGLGGGGGLVGGGSTSGDGGSTGGDGKLGRGGGSDGGVP
jgi:hypothetical protein